MNISKVLNCVGNGMLNALGYIHGKVGRKPILITVAFATLPSVSICGGIMMEVSKINVGLGLLSLFCSMAILWWAPIYCTIKLLDKIEERKKLFKEYEKNAISNEQQPLNAI